MVLTGRGVYRGLRNCGEVELGEFRSDLERSGYEVRPKTVASSLLERHGLNIDKFGLIAVKESNDVHEYVAVGQRDDLFGKSVDVVKGVYRENEFLPTMVRDVENNPGFITRFIFRNGLPVVFGMSLLSGFVGAEYWNSNPVGVGIGLGTAATIAGFTHLVRKCFEFYLRTCEGVEYGSRAVRSVVDGSVKHVLVDLGD